MEKLPSSNISVNPEILDSIKDPLEGKILAFEANETEKINKRSANVEIENVTQIYQGGEGSAGYARRVVEADGRVVLDGGEKSASQRFVLKELKDDGDTENLLKRHGELKAAGLPTWNTLRINKEDQIALMTSGNQNGMTAIMPNNMNGSDIAKLAESHGVQIADYKGLVNDMCTTAIKAGKEGIQIGDDVWTYFFDDEAVKENKPFAVNYLLGDLDEIRSTSPEKLDAQDEYSLKFKNKKKNSRNQIGRINLDNLEVSFSHLSRYLPQDSRESFIKYTENYVQQLKSALTD